MDTPTLTARLRQEYGWTDAVPRRIPTGVGGDTYIIETAQGHFILKQMEDNGMNHPEAEPALCGFLLSRGIPVSEFVPTLDGRLVWWDGERFCHLQRLIDGSAVELHSASEPLLAESARMLGRIHTVLAEYPPLPPGLGEGFFRNRTPERTVPSYRRSLAIALERGDSDIADDLGYRIRRMERIPAATFDLGRLSCRNSHGDYGVNQLICRDGSIRAVIDWTAACVMPVVWEILRSFLYASPACREGTVDEEGLLRYVRAYREEAPLSRVDLETMPHLFHYQIAVCDYYGQYYGSDAANRAIFLHQARFSTRLMRWFEENADRLSERLGALA